MTKVLTAEEAAAYLKVHVETIRRLARSGTLPAMKVGRGWRFDEHDLRHWAETNHLHAQPAHILAIDDEAFVLKALDRMLSKLGHRVSTALTGELALDILNTDRPDLVLLDLKMPGMSGPAILAKIRATEPDLPVIIVTGYAESNIMIEALPYSPITVVPKPFKPEQLTKAIELALNGSRQQNILSDRI